MQRAGVYDDHVIGRDIEHFALDIELAAPVHAVENLGAGVGVRHRVPVAAEAAFADIHQPDGLPRGNIHVQLIPCVHGEYRLF